MDAILLGVFAIVLFVVMLFVIPRVLPLLWSLWLQWFRERIARWLSARHRLARVLLLIASFVAGSGLIVVLVVMCHAVVLGRVIGRDIVVFGTAGVMLAFSGTMTHSCVRALTVIYDASVPLPEEFVLYLRSFQTDGEYNPFVAATGLRQFTEEEELTSLLSNVGPAVAYQDPNTNVPQLGGIRLRLPSDWQPYVKAAIERARLIVLRIGTTTGLQWEMEQVIEMGALPKTLLVIPEEASRTTGSRKDRDASTKDAVLLEIRDRRYGHFTIPKSKRTERARLLFLDESGDLSIGYLDDPKSSSWFPGFSRGARFRGPLSAFAAQHGFALSHRFDVSDVGRAVAFICMGLFGVWWWIVSR